MTNKARTSIDSRNRRKARAAASLAPSLRAAAYSRAVGVPDPAAAGDAQNPPTPV